MNQLEFFSILLGLEEFFDKKLTDFQRDQYYKHLGNFPEDVMKEAIEKMIGTHKYRSIPLVAEVMTEAKKGMVRRRESRSEDMDELRKNSICMSCNGTGFKLMDHYLVKETPNNNIEAFYCVCEIGSKMKTAHGRHFKNHKRTAVNL